MKRNEVGDFTVLYVEPGDQRADLFQVASMQKKPVVIMLASQAGILQRPDDFTLLKYVKRQTALPIIFILPHGSQQAQLAARNGFAVYQSMDALLDSLSLGQLAQKRAAKPTRSLYPANTAPLSRSSAVLHPSGPSASVQASPLPTHDEQSRPEQDSRRIPQPVTPIPPSLMLEEEPEPQYSDPHRILSPVATDNIQDNISNVRPDINSNIAKRITAPLPTGEAAYAPVPAQTPPTVQRPVEIEQDAVGEWLASQSLASTSGKTTPKTSSSHRTFSDGFTLGRLAPALSRARGKPRLYILLCVLVLMAIGSFLILPRFLNGAASTAQINGHLVFTSSGQVSETSSQGIEDQITLDLTNLSAPASGKALYAWLLGDKGESVPQTILLGKLQLNNGTAHLFYPGNAQHTNLLLTMSRVLVTEEGTAFTPVAPSPDQGTWRYYSEFSTAIINMPGNTKNFSFLDHLRHLLATDPTLEELELPGGLNNWLYINTGKVKEWVDSTRQPWEETKDIGFVRRQLARTLQFVDGNTFVYQDLPPGTPLLVNERLARLGLINVADANQVPPAYVNHISHHLTGLLEAKPTPAMRQKITGLITAIGNVNQWLKQVRQDAQQLMKMTDEQMMQQSTLSVINDMIANVDRAYSGQPDPSTNTMREGVNWFHNQMQFLATLDITPWDGTSLSPTGTRNIPGPHDSPQSQPRVLIAKDKSAKT